MKRPIQFFHLPVPKGRTDDAYFAPLEKLKLGPQTELYLGLIHHNDAAGDATRLAAARRHTRVDGIGTECGMARGDPARLPALLAAHVRAAELADLGRISPLIAGLDPAIHRSSRKGFASMDARVEPGHDASETATVT